MAVRLLVDIVIWALMFSQLIVAPPGTIHSAYTLPKLAVLILVLAAASWRPGRRDARQPWLWYAFLAAFAVSTYFSFAWPMSLCGIYLSGAETMLLAVLCFLTYRAAQAGDPNEALEAGAAAAAVSVILAVFMTTQSGRWVGTTGQAARYGSALAVGAAMALGAARPTRASRDVLVAQMLLILGGVVMTGSRGAVLAVLAAAVYLHGRKIPKWAYAAAGAALAATLWRKGDMWASDAMRFEQARAGWAVFLAHPWVGCGPATFLPVAPTVNQFHTHILPLNVLATQGLLGAAAWTVLAVDAWRASGRGARAAYVAAAVCSMFNPLPESTYVVMAVLYGASRRGSIEEARAWPRLVVAHALAIAVLVMTLADRHAQIGGELEDAARERKEAKEVSAAVALQHAAFFHWTIAHRLNPLEFYYFAKTYKR